MPDQRHVEDLGGTMRLGSFPCLLSASSKAYEAYGEAEVYERHRHRYEVNNAFRAALEEKGMALTGVSPDGRLVEVVEVPEHPWFVACQYHPEFKSRPNRCHPLFREFVIASLKQGRASRKICGGYNGTPYRSRGESKPFDIIIARLIEGQRSFIGSKILGGC